MGVGRDWEGTQFLTQAPEGHSESHSEAQHWDPGPASPSTTSDPTSQQKSVLGLQTPQVYSMKWPLCSWKTSPLPQRHQQSSPFLLLTLERRTCSRRQFPPLPLWWPVANMRNTRNPGSAQFDSVTQSCPTLCDPIDCSKPGFPIHHQLPELTQIHVDQVSYAIQPFHPLCPLFLLPSIFPSIRVCSKESVLRIRWPEFWGFSFSISPFNKYSAPIYFRMYWLDLLAVQEALKSLFQHHSSKASILQCSAFFTVQLSHP